MLERIESFIRWLSSGRCRIRDIHGHLVPLIPNFVQQLILAEMLRQARAGKPIRLVILKSRKHGVTTIIQALKYFLCSTYEHQVACMMAHLADSTREIFEITKLISSEWGMYSDKVGRQMIRFPQRYSRYFCHTAGSGDATAGGTPNLLHMSEVALWREKKEQTEYVSVESVPNVPTSIIVYESTARGRELMWQRFDAARRGRSSYTALFFPWVMNPINVLAATGYERNADDHAVAQMAASLYQVELSDDQLNWRRCKIVDIGEANFRQEHPLTPEEAVSARRDLVLPNMSACVVDELPRDIGGGDLIGGGDFGYHDPTVILTGFYHDQIVYVVSIYRATEALAEEHLQGVMSGHLYYCDPSALGAREELAVHAMRGGRKARFVAAPRMIDSTTANNNPEWDKVAEIMRKGRLRIMANVADQIVAEADTLEWNPQTGRPEKKRSDSCGHFDTIDALRYMILGAVVGGHTKTPDRDVSGDTRRAALRRW